uniref:Uncharacterized protein n=1 Tax=Caenorhabditis japonica TaxID=281687 RepID=A0A8R1DTH7_CAEJA
MYRCTILFALLPLLSSAPVSVNIDDQDAVNLGAYDRARFELVETFHPLQPASAVTNDQIAEVRARAAGVKQNEAAISIELPMAQIGGVSTTPERLAFGEWTEWTNWSVCQNGERSRVRTCVSRRPALRVVCHGEAIEIEKCYVDAGEGHIPVASDPWSIEREISGDFV